MKEFIKNFTTTTNDYDVYGRLKPTSITNLAQDVAGIHSTLLGLGYEKLYAQGEIFLLIRNKFKILKPLKNIKDVTIKTRPLKNELFNLPRIYDFYYKDELFIQGESIWMLYDFNKKEIVTNIQGVLKDIEKINHERFRKIPTFEFNKETYYRDFIVSKSYLDMNMHFNNTKAFDIFIDSFDLKEEDIISEFEIEYHKQSYLNDLLSIYRYKEGNICHMGVYKDNELKFYLKVKIN
ncbi:MAG TPA: acyl-ACP thioesterase domain-containing protein [Candidatus Onthovivens sp.]|nr:acyl-ACP thioesterase domain-containing protein [Candidatus Onthovivens sp.]